MALFRRRPRDAPPPPELPGLSPAEAEEFMADLGALLDARGDSWSVEDGILRLKGSAAEYGLSNVAQAWRQSRPSERRDLLLERLAVIDAQQESPQIAPADMPALARPQLWALADAAELEGDLVMLEVADDLVAVLSVDLPTTVHAVHPRDIAGTGLTEDELWQRAVQQLDDGESIERNFLDDDQLVEVLVSDSHFLATQVLALEELMGALPEHGALVALPHRHVLALHPIRDTTVLDAVGVMAPFAVEQFEAGPGSLSAHLYWWHRDGLERIVVDDVKGAVSPPDSFVAMLEKLPEP